MADSNLKGRRVLVVEDESIISMLIEDTLVDLGCEVAETASRLDHAITKANDASVDLAVVDVNLNGSPSYDVAEVLMGRGIPFVFVTGYGATGLRPEFQHLPVVQKPFQESDLERALLAALRASVS
jgi:CheY-like chemotaxis protein